MVVVSTSEASGVTSLAPPQKKKEENAKELGTWQA